MTEVDATRLAFDEQIAFFREKLGNLVPTEKWTDLWQAQHDRAFMVAGAAKADLLNDFATAIDQAIAEGQSLDWFQKRFDAIVEDHGWAHTGAADWRARVIYQTNMNTSYAAGRLAQLRDPELQQVKPLWMYKHNDVVDEPRPEHQAWDGITLPADHEWFKTHYPPNGWGCQCYVVAVSADEVAANGGRVTDAPPMSNRGIDPGFAYQPGDTRTADIRATIDKKAADLPAPLGDALRRDADSYR